jgi:hypothetical protein
VGFEMGARGNARKTGGAILSGWNFVVESPLADASRPGESRAWSCAIIADAWMARSTSTGRSARPSARSVGPSGGSSPSWAGQMSRTSALVGATLRPSPRQPALLNGTSGSAPIPEVWACTSFWNRSSSMGESRRGAHRGKVLQASLQAGHRRVLELTHGTAGPLRDPSRSS